jgi:hypothetical protein
MTGEPKNRGEPRGQTNKKARVGACLRPSLCDTWLLGVDERPPQLLRCCLALRLGRGASVRRLALRVLHNDAEVL